MHTIELSDNEVFVVRSALNEAYERWRRESGPAWEYIAEGVVFDITVKLPKIPAKVTAESILRERSDRVLFAKLGELAKLNQLTPEAALKLLEEARALDAELKDF